MNGQPQQGYPPPSNAPFPATSQFASSGQRPPAPLQQFIQPPSSAGFPPTSGSIYNMFHKMTRKLIVHNFGKWQMLTDFQNFFTFRLNSDCVMN